MDETISAKRKRTGWARLKYSWLDFRIAVAESRLSKLQLKMNLLLLHEIIRSAENKPTDG